MRGLNAIIAFLLLGAVMVALALYVNQAALTCRMRECSFIYPPNAVSLAVFVGLVTAGLVVLMVLANWRWPSPHDATVNRRAS